ncbi:MAG: hypothetical protein IKW58_01355 [Alphaproteobacteria bacterium]|nr:hypothetical protein [Alphaproteobacteria bacterium]
MIIKKVRPSRSSTSSQVFWFWLKAGYHKIAQEHHYNMLMGIGCKDRTLKQFIKKYFFETREVIDALIDSQKQKKSILDKEFLVNHFATHPAYDDKLQNKILAIKGIEWMLEKGFVLEVSVLNNYINRANNSSLNSLIPYAEKLKKAEYYVFNCGYAPLVVAYLKAVKTVNESNIDHLLKFDNIEVYEAFFDNHLYKATDKFIDKILSEKSDEIVNKLATSARLNAEQEISLIKRNNLSLLKSRFEDFGSFLHKESVDYLSQNSSDEIFKEIALSDKFYIIEDKYPNSFYERLFKLNDRNTLKSFIKSSPLPSEFEKELLKLNDEELIRVYFGDKTQVFTNKAAIYILEKGLEDEISKMLRADYSIGFYAEAWLFKSGLDDYITKYLENRYPTGFGEACLIKFANKDIVLNWLSDEVIIRDLSFVAAMQRKDIDIIQRLIELKPYFYEVEQDLRAFMLFAPKEVIAQFFENLEEREYIANNFEVSNETARKIFETRDKEIQELFVYWFDFDDDTELCSTLVECAHKDIVIKKLKDEDFHFDKRVLFQRGDKDIISFYVMNYELMDGDEELELLQTLDENLVLIYQEEFDFECIENNILEDE